MLWIVPIVRYKFAIFQIHNFLKKSESFLRFLRWAEFPFLPVIAFFLFVIVIFLAIQLFGFWVLIDLYRCRIIPPVRLSWKTSFLKATIDLNAVYIKTVATSWTTIRLVYTVRLWTWHKIYCRPKVCHILAVYPNGIAWYTYVPEYITPYIYTEYRETCAFFSPNWRLLKLNLSN